MGANLARNLARRAGRSRCSTARRSARAAPRRAPRGGLRGQRVDRGLRRVAERPRRIDHHGQGRAPDRRGHRAAGRCSSQGDIIIDGGNANFQDTIRRERGAARARVCTSSAPASPAARRARCTARRSCPAARPRPTRRSGRSSSRSPPRSTASPCCTHVGPDGAGHFVKMVHNGIEYADMQLIAEAYDLLRTRCGLDADAIADVFADWNEGDLESYLIEITAEVLRQDATRDRAAAGRRHPRPGRAEGHRGVDGAGRARPGRAGHRHRRGGLRARAVRQARASAPRRADGLPGPRPRRGGAGDATSTTTSARRCTRPRSSPTRRASTRSSRGAEEYELGHRPRRRSRRSGAAAASSARASSTASRRPTTRTRTWRTC